MKKLAYLILLLVFASTLAVAQTVPTCNAFDTVSGVPIDSATGSTLCTDFFGVANYASSPLPVGPVDIAGFTVVNGGSGYTAPTVTIDDFYATPGVTAASGCAATQVNGIITGVTCTAGGDGYMAPVVTISDPAGSGAVVLAKLVSATAGGLRKFLDTLPDLKAVAAGPDTTTFPGAVAGNPAADFYVIGLVQYTQQMHTDLLPTTLRGYCQLAAPSYTACVTPASYLGPVILAQKSRPVRILFKNMLPTGPGGNLFIPVDTTYMGAGVGPDGVSPYLQNRATLHLHGGATPWISDGTPHQWTVPAGETTTYQKGVSTQNVPDMWFDLSGNLLTSCQEQTSCATTGATTDPGPGAMTFYWTNQQGGRLMFFHDHAYGITRLNVYAGEAAGYLLYDPTEESGLLNATAPGTLATNTTTQPLPDTDHLIPLVIQDKTFVPGASQLAAEDPTWIWGTKAASGINGPGDLWFNHVYPTNQNPADMGGANAFGRWDYGPWFFPPQNSLTAAGPGPLGPNTAVTIPCTSASFPGVVLAPTAANNYLEGCPIIPNPSGTPESFMDTPLVNGKAYPVLHVAPAAYRFHILSAGNDRSLNLSLYLACGQGTFTEATNCAAATLAGAQDKEVPMVPAVQGQTGTAGYVYPDQLDGRIGGVPDINAAGPSWVQIGSEGGVLPSAVVIPPTPVGYEYNRRSITVTNVSSHGLLLGPAERADVIVDFTAYGGKTLILYNDSPAPIPAFDSRIDYFTGDLDQVQQGGAPTTLPGYGPNTRTIMQIVVDGASPNVTPFALGSLQAQLPGIFATSTGPVPAIIPESTYPVASGGNTATNTYARISDNTITYTPIGATSPITYMFEQKAIQELFTLDYGRMNATLGVELPFTNFVTQTTVPYGYVDWPTELMQDGQTQIWKLTHNGVDTHFIHFHLFNVQVINRIGWDGAVKPPDANELGWKDTVRMNPLEDIVFAMLPVKQILPWPIRDSVRSMDVTMPNGLADPAISGLDPNSGNATITTVNNPVNFGWEYVWHCHILGHEENDMMRPIIFEVAPPAPSNLAGAGTTTGKYRVNLSWTDNSASETGFTVQRATDQGFTQNLTTFTVPPSSPNTLFGGPINFADTTASKSGNYYYQVLAFDALSPASPLVAPWAPVTMVSAASPFIHVGPPPPAASVTPASLAFGNQNVGTTSAVRTVTLSNTGGSALSISSIAVTANFAQTNNCGTSLAAGSTCTISVTFRPTAVGALTGTLTVTDNSGGVVGSTQTVSLTGTGVPVPLASLSPTSHNFGTVLLAGPYPSFGFTMTNTGTANLVFTSVAVTGNAAGDFPATNGCPIGGTGLAPNATCTVTVTFHPTRRNGRSANLVFTDNSGAVAGSTQTAALSGTGQ